MQLCGSLSILCRPKLNCAVCVCGWVWVWVCAYVLSCSGYSYLSRNISSFLGYAPDVIKFWKIIRKQVKLCNYITQLRFFLICFVLFCFIWLLIPPLPLNKDLYCLLWVVRFYNSKRSINKEIKERCFKSEMSLTRTYLLSVHSLKLSSKLSTTSSILLNYNYYGETEDVKIIFD